MSSVTERPSLQQTRQMAFIAEFTTDIRYVKGERNFVADALSRRNRKTNQSWTKNPDSSTFRADGPRFSST